LTRLLARAGVRLERIVSLGQTTPEGQWCDQETDEWVLLLRGGAYLTMMDGGPPQEERTMFLGPGDYVFLPAHCRHRVAWTHPDYPTLWLALHLPPAPPTE
jgi:cupin 2 domain-containing protein